MRSVPGTVTISKPSIEAQKDTGPDRGWKVILFNDDVTPFDVVIHGLQRAAGLSLEVAEMVALEAHRENEAVVKRGLTQEDAELICERLRQHTAIPSVCPGVDCEARADDA